MSTSFILINCHAATMQHQQLSCIQNAAIVCEGEQISWVGPQAECPKEYKDFEHKDCQGAWVTPGFIDCHTHVVYAGQRADELAKRLAGQSYAEIHQQGGGIFSTVQATRSASFEKLLELSLQRIRQMQQHGVTTVEIKSGYGLDLETEIKMLEVARAIKLQENIDVAATYLGLHTKPPEYETLDEYVDFCLSRVLTQIVDRQLAEAVDIFCENIAFSKQHAEKLFGLAKHHHLKLKVHAEQLTNQHAAQFAAEHGALSADHLEHLDESGVKAMQDAGTVAVLLPGAYYFLQDNNLPPIQLLRDHQVPMAVATDCNPGSSPSCSLPLMMNMAGILFGLTHEEVLLGVTIHAARALGLTDRGIIAPQMRADLAVWPIDTPAEIAYSMGDCQITARVVTGHWLE